jgi:hypothetical protein
MAGGDGAVMPDGGLSPCIIKVVGVGGGGCNAVSISIKLACIFTHKFIFRCIYVYTYIDSSFFGSISMIYCVLLGSG